MERCCPLCNQGRLDEKNFFQVLDEGQRKEFVQAIKDSFPQLIDTLVHAKKIGFCRLSTERETEDIPAPYGLFERKPSGWIVFGLLIRYFTQAVSPKPGVTKTTTTVNNKLFPVPDCFD